MAQRPNRAKSPVPKEGEDSPKVAEKTDEKKTSGGLLTPKNGAIAAVVGVVLFGLYKQFGSQIDVKEGLEKAVLFVEGQGNTAVIWYCVLTFLGVVCLIPTTPMEIAGGFLFSPSWGMWTVLFFTGFAKLCANSVSVLIARFILKDWVMKNVVAKSDLLKMVSEAVKEEPWKMAFLVRGSMAPLFVKNYGLGVMEIAFLPIAACSMIFTNFYAFQNIYMGSSLQNIKEVFAPKTAAAGPMDWPGTAKKMMPIAFNILLVLFLVKAVKAQMVKQKAQIEKNLKEKGKEDSKSK